ncbi:MAG TPA: T9SS type A sorting domain-containing protein, partial [Flavipsychrobacter sp.]|nr:T9SS type A sorting domain-containing protein [Flavipsychrobacter sp.]
DQGGTVTTICGTGVAGFSGDGGPAASAAISFVFDMVFDKDDNLFILFTGRMRKIDASTGIISTLLGDGTLGNTGDGGSALLAKTAARSLAVDDHGNIFLSEFNNSVIRLLNSQGIIDRIGGTTVNGYSGDGGAALLADFNHPDGMALDSCGNMYIADAMNHRIRKVTYTTCDPLVIPDLQAGPSFGVYPNPVVSTLTITSPDRPAQVSISSSMGQVVMSNSHYAEKIVLNVAALVSGVYFLTLTSSDGHKQTKKIIKE